MNIAAKLSPQDLCRVLELANIIAGLKPKCSLALLPPDRRDQAIRDGYRRALESCPKTIAELSGILSRYSCEEGTRHDA